jgi:hypothetical protein
VSNNHATQTLTVDDLHAVWLRFTDRMPACPREVRVHPDYYPVFVGDLWEVGFERRSFSGPEVLTGLPIYEDAEVPFGKRRIVYPDGRHTDL